MIYKVDSDVLNDLKKRLLANNKLLTSLRETAHTFLDKVTIDNAISKNNKQIKLLEDEYYI